MSKIPPPWGAIRELEFIIDALRNEKALMRGHINFMESRCAELQKELSSLRESRDFLLAQKLRLLLKKADRMSLRLKQAWLMLRPMDGYSRMRLSDRLLEQYREVFAEDESMHPLLRRRDLYKRLAVETEGAKLPPDLPTTSVLIFYDGDREHLVRCRMAIENAPPRAPFELLLVALPPHRLSRRSFPQATIVPVHGKLSGWQSALNLAAQQARGEYLLFLDGAAEVLPGWLDELAFALYRRPDAGPIAAQLLDPDTGALRSCGHMLRDDGTGAPRGQGEAPETPYLSCFHEVDFCSEAGFIIRREHFNAAGGFDPEDGNMAAAALALRCRSHGWTCRVMPTAKLLLDRDELAATEAERVRIAAMRSGMPSAAAPALRVFYADAEVPMPDRGSGGMDAFFFMERMIAAGYQVVFFGENMPEWRRRYENDLERMGIEVLRPAQVDICDYLREHGASFDLVFISRVYIAQKLDLPLRLYAPQAAYVFNTVDLHFLRERREAELHASVHMRMRASMTEVLELTIASRADAVVVISSEEKELLEQRYGMARVHHIPQARVCFGSRQAFAQRSGIAFVGSAHPPNLDALKFYVLEILPRLEARGVDGTLTVIGEALRDDIRAQEEYRCVAECPKIRFVGYVEDLSAYFDRVRLTIAPLRYGAGTKGKIASSMAYGVPCVSTRFGTEGTGMIDGEHIRIADTPEAFAAAMTELLTDETGWRKISEGGIRFLREKYDPESVWAQTKPMLEDALQHKRTAMRKIALLTEAEELAAAATEAGPIRPADALRQCEPRSGADILCEMLCEVDRQELQRQFRGAVFVDELSAAEEGKFDFILLDRHPQPELYDLLKIAKFQLYDGGRVIFPLPPDLDAPKLWAEMLGSIGFQQIFLIRAVAGAPPFLCAVKAIPY